MTLLDSTIGILADSPPLGGESAKIQKSEAEDLAVRPPKGRDLIFLSEAIRKWKYPCGRLTAKSFTCA